MSYSEVDYSQVKINPSDYEIVNHKGFLDANRHGTKGKVGNTLHHHFNSYIGNLDKIINKRSEDGNLFHGHITFGAFQPASNFKMLGEAVRSTHHLRNFFLLQEKQRVPYFFYYFDNETETVKYAGFGIFTTNPNFSLTHSKTKSKTDEGLVISIEYRHQNRMRHNMEYKNDCTQAKVTITGDGIKLFEACPYINTGFEDREGILRVKLDKRDLETKMNNETFFMIPTKKVTVTINRGVNLITDKKTYDKSDIDNYGVFIKPFSSTSIYNKNFGNQLENLLKRPNNGNIQNSPHGGKKRSKRKRVSRRKNRKSRNTKKSRKHAKTRKSRR